MECRITKAGMVLLAECNREKLCYPVPLVYKCLCVST